MDSKTQERQVITIGTRKSRLAMWQANTVHGLCEENFSVHQWDVKGILSTGDKNLEIELSSFSEKGVFTKELDTALLDGTIDLAVHSMKDLPTQLPEGICLAAVLARADCTDAVVISKAMQDKGIMKLEDMPEGSIIGTSSLRRRALLRRAFPKLETKNIRGNLDTRLRKLDEGQFDALMLASAGLKRLGMVDRLTESLDPSVFPFAVCQGAMAVVCRSKPEDQWIRDMLDTLSCRATGLCCAAERSMLRTLEGGCKVPIAVRSQFDAEKGRLQLDGLVISADGTNVVTFTKVSNDVRRGDDKAACDAARNLGMDVAHSLLQRGADKILDEINRTLREGGIVH